MQLHDIHRSPEEKLAHNSGATLSAIQEMHKTMREMKPADEMTVNLKGVSVLTIKGDRGDRGERGEDGRDGINGKNGLPGARGERGFPGKDGKDGIGIDGKNGKDGENGKDGSPDAPDEVVEKVNTASKKIKAERIEGMTRIMREVANYGSNPQGGATGGANQILIKNNGTLVSAHVTELDFTTNMSLTYGNNGKITVTATGGSGLTELTATGTVDGSNTTFTFLSQPSRIVSDHAWYKVNSGWTWDAGTLTATMSVPPVDEIYGYE